MWLIFWTLFIRSHHSRSFLFHFHLNMKKSPFLKMLWVFKPQMMANVKIYRIYLNARQGIFPKIWCSSTSMWGCLNLHTKHWTASLWIRPRRDEPDHAEPNQTMKSQTMACITKSSCEVTTLLRYYMVLSANSLPMFRDNLSQFSVMGFRPLPNFLKEHDVSEAGCYRPRST